MAIWHFEIPLIPEGAPAPIDTNEGMDCLASWRGAVRPDWDAVSAGILPKGASWSPEVDIWEDSDILQLYVLHGRGQMEYASLRVDVRQRIGLKLDTLLARIKAAGLMFAFCSSDICEPSRQELDEHLKRSLAFRRFNAGTETL
jgi:hypothetical protein